MKFPAFFLVFLFAVCFFPAHPAHAAAYDDMLIAVKLGDTSSVQYWLGRGMDVNTSDREGNTLLMLAVRENRPQLVSLFIQARAKVNARNISGDSALKLAAYQGHLGMVRELVQAGAEVNERGWTPLIYAAFNGHDEVVAFLLQQGARINTKSESGMTALMAASRGGFLPVVERLLAAGATVDIRDGQNETALDWANKTKNDVVAARLRAAGAHTNKELPRRNARQKQEDEAREKAEEERLQMNSKGTSQDEAIALLKEAKLVESSHINEGAEPSRLYHAYSILAKSHNAAEHFARLYAEATEAGKAYAILWFHKNDQAAFADAKATWMGQEHVTVQFGCVKMQLTKAEFLSEIENEGLADRLGWEPGSSRQN